MITAAGVLGLGLCCLMLRTRWYNNGMNRLLKHSMFVPALIVCLVFMSGCTVKRFQDDSDVYRLRHLAYYADLVEEYRKRVGHYPFQGMEDLPVYVFIANSMQEDFIEKKDFDPHVRYQLKTFIAALEEGLGWEIEEYYDPQFVPVKKPNFYVYIQEGEGFSVVVNLSRGYGLAKKISDGYYKLEITDHPSKEAGVFGFDELVNDNRFRKAINIPVSKKGFFESREAAFLHETKRR